VRADNDLRFEGLRFVVTGRLESLSRQEAQARIKELGGAVSSSVSKKTSYVIIGADPGSKYDTAVRLQVPVLEEDQFLQMLDESPLEPQEIQEQEEAQKSLFD
jgi:DNA ligase (NAD+)